MSEIDYAERTVFCRVDLNVPMKDFQIKDETRIQSVLPTLKLLLEKDARIVLASHMGRPKGKHKEELTLLPVGARLAELLDCEVIVPDDCVGIAVKKIRREQRPVQIVLLENLRFHAEEEKNDVEFAKKLKEDAQVYITDAFGALHRAHASTDALPRLFAQKACGLLVEKELNALSPLLKNPSRPYTVILGGAKVSDKLRMIENLMSKADQLLIGGAMAFTFLKAMGHSVGQSLVENDYLEQAQRLLQLAEASHVKLLLPIDFQLGKSVTGEGETKVSEGVDIDANWIGLDIGPRSSALFLESLSGQQTIFWNGPMGLFEVPPYDQATMDLAKGLAKLHCTRIVGGGDSLAALSRAGVTEAMTHVSTGGGATLEYLEGQALPGLESVSV
jgi:phosphoglycerate kinase